MGRSWELVICSFVACDSLGNEKFGGLLLLLLLAWKNERKGVEFSDFHFVSCMHL
jgi:hypothetical protein